MLSCMYNEYKNPGVSEREIDCLRKKGMKTGGVIRMKSDVKLTSLSKTAG